MIVGLVLTAGLALSGVLAQGCTTVPPAAKPVVAEGYETRLLLNGLRNPRHLVVDGEGNLLVAQQGGVGINRVVLEETAEGDVCVTSNDVLIPDQAVRTEIRSPCATIMFIEWMG